MRISSVIISALLGGTTSANATPKKLIRERASSTNSSGTVCSSGHASTVAPHKNFWQELTHQESADVIKLLHSNTVGFNLTAAKDAGRYAPVSKSAWPRSVSNSQTSWDNRMYVSDH